MHITLSILDWIVLAVYLVGITIIGLFVSRKVKTSSGFFTGNRSFGKMIVLAQALGTGTSTDQAVGVAGAAYTAGLSGIWYQWIWLFTTPFYWILAPIFRRLRMTTIAEFFNKRYGRAYSLAYAALCIYLFALWTGIAIKGTAETVSPITGVPEWVIAVVVVVIFTIYSTAGGLVAVATINFVQGLFIILLSFMMLPFGFHKVGGFAGLHRTVPVSFFEVFSRPGGELTPFVVAMLVLSGLIGIVVQPHIMSVAGTGKTEMDCRFGWTSGNFIKRFCTVGWTLTGLLAVVLFPGIPFAHRERVFGMAVVNLLPSGLIGLMVSSLLATVMAYCSSFMVNGSALFTRDLYKPLIGHHKSDAHYLMVARISSLVIMAAGFSLGLKMSSVVGSTVQFISILPIIGIAFWIGIIWPRANRYGAWACTLGSGSVFFGTKLYGLPNAWSSLYCMVTGVVLIVVVSWLTKPEPTASLERIFGYLKVPVGEENLLPQGGDEL